MKFFLALFFSLSLTVFSNAQNATLAFDGVDDYIDLGGEVGNGVRTIEMWFKLPEAIDATLSDFATLTAREISAFDGNTDEFTLSFQPFYVPNSGTLRFDIDGTAPFKSVYSDNNSWNANQWYHVAAVVDPVEGMMLFIDGSKQASTHPYTGATGMSTKITTIGCWGDLYDRYFNGEIDDVRFSSEALYATDFSPACSDVITQTNDIGLWNFNENSGIVAVDSSANNNDGKIFGATWTNALFCGNVASFDGVDDHIDLGGEVGNGVRTIEMWFKLPEAIDATLSNFATLTAREISAFNGNTDEFTLSFQPSQVPNPGTLRFDIDGTAPFKSVYSDNNSWNANQWYHVAAVVDPVEGMMLFIDGSKQASTHPYTGATGISTKITTIGCWGDLYDRYFNGEIDDVRFSSEALYTTDFSPACSDVTTQTNDIGVWNFNENIGLVAVDSSANANDGEFIGVSRVDAQICPDSIVTNTKNLVNAINDISLKVYPNPSSDIFYFEYAEPNPVGLSITIYNSIGQELLSQKITDGSFEVRLQNKASGIYFYHITNGRMILKTGKLIKK